MVVGEDLEAIRAEMEQMEGDEDLMPDEMTMLRSGGSKRPRRRRRLFRLLCSRRGWLVMAAGFVLLCMFSFFFSGSSYSKASLLAETARKDGTGENRLSDWLPFLEAVSKTYLKHKPPTNLPAADTARDCASKGWAADCTKEVFKKNEAERKLELLKADQESLHHELDKAVHMVRPSEQELRLPASVALKYTKATAQAQQHVCEIPPKDLTCIQARGQEIQTIGVLESDLRQVVSEAQKKKTGADESLTQRDSRLSALAKLVHLQIEKQGLAIIRQSDSLKLNAVTAVVLHQTLESIGETSSEYNDILLYDNSPDILYIGPFKHLRFHGKGTMYYKSGTPMYIGEFRDGRFHGQGVLVSSEGAVVWTGQFEDGSPVQGFL